MNIDFGYAPSGRVQRYEGQLRMYRRDRVVWPLFPNRLPVVSEERLHRLPKEDRVVLRHERNRNLPEALERAMRYAPAEAQAMLDSGQTFSAVAMGRVLLKAVDRQVFEARAWNDGVPRAPCGPRSSSTTSCRSGSPSGSCPAHSARAPTIASCSSQAGRSSCRGAPPGCC